MNKVNITQEEYKEIYENHMDLCSELHENWDLIPQKLKEKIEDLIYKYFKP